jgi:hypothetical protein
MGFNAYVMLNQVWRLGMFRSKKKDYDYIAFLCKLRCMSKISTYDINIDLGRYYGYPPCCIKHFAECVEKGTPSPGQYMRLKYGPSEHVGYVRCPKCRSKKVEKLKKNILRELEDNE